MQIHYGERGFGGGESSGGGVGSGHGKLVSWSGRMPMGLIIPQCAYAVHENEKNAIISK